MGSVEIAPEGPYVLRGGAGAVDDPTDNLGAASRGNGETRRMRLWYGIALKTRRCIKPTVSSWFRYGATFQRRAGDVFPRQDL